MTIKTHRQYDKQWLKLTVAQQKRAMTSLRIYIADPSAPLLRLHQLKGEYYPQFSLSAGGDLRIHFTKVDETTIVLMAIGTHSQLYK